MCSSDLEVAAVREQRRQAIGVGVAVAGLAALLLALWAARSAQVTDEKEAADDAERRVARLQQERARLADGDALTTELSQRRGQVEFLLADDVAWTRLFNEVATVIPNDVWLTSFAGSKGAPGSINVSATGFDQTSTARWLQRIGDLDSLTALWVPNSTKSGAGSAALVTFSSQANLTSEANASRTARYTGGAQ